MSKVEFYQKVAGIQADLKAPKGQRNDYSNFNYRNCEDILEAVKPLLDGLLVLITDEIVQIGDRFYVKATATITDGEHEISNTAFAREPFEKKGMDAMQITGATSSYARKYALNGLLMIDDAKDVDSMDNSNDNVKSSSGNNQQQNDNKKPWYNDFDKEVGHIARAIREGMTPEKVIEKIEQGFKINNEVKQKIRDIKK